MKKSTFSPAQIVEILKEFDNGKSAEAISREYDVSKASLYKWRQRYGSLRAETDQGAGEGKCPSQAHVCQPGHGAGRCQIHD
ncbi:MAG: transposase [Spirosomataceae bacterium]